MFAPREENLLGLFPADTEMGMCSARGFWKVRKVLSHSFQKNCPCKGHRCHPGRAGRGFVPGKTLEFLSLSREFVFAASPLAGELGKEPGTGRKWGTGSWHGGEMEFKW